MDALIQLEIDNESILNLINYQKKDNAEYFCEGMAQIGEEFSNAHC